jgi:hypothetical protein
MLLQEEGILSLHTLLPRADVLRMVERHPSLLFQVSKVYTPLRFSSITEFSRNVH